MINRSFENIELEELVLCGDVEERLEKANLSVTHGTYTNI
jgi:DUF1009 family protein